MREPWQAYKIADSADNIFNLLVFNEDLFILAPGPERATENLSPGDGEHELTSFGNF